MKKLVPILKRYFYHVLLDSPAGVGSGFRSAASGADRALVVCNPDPVCVRSAGVARELLGKLGVPEMRLVINRFNRELFRETDAYSDLDGVIDGAGIRLMGVVPEDFALAASFLQGKSAREDSPGMKALCRVAGRLEGETIPLSGL